MGKKLQGDSLHSAPRSKTGCPSLEMAAEVFPARRMSTTDSGSGITDYAIRMYTLYKTSITADSERCCLPYSMLFLASDLPAVSQLSVSNRTARNTPHKPLATSPSCYSSSRWHSQHTQANPLRPSW